MQLHALFLSLAAGLVLAVAAAPGAVLRLPGFAGDGWQPLTFPRVERHTRYDVVTEDGAPVLRARSQCSASARIARVETLDLERTPLLAWRWKVTRPLETAASEREKAGDDFAARVYVSFRFVPERASMWERLKRRAAEGIYGAALPGEALNYVWTREQPRGSHWPSPYTASSRMVSLGRGPLPDWRSERVDVAADYRARFGAEPPPVLFVGIMSDSDDSCGEAEAFFADFRFEPHPPAQNADAP